MSADETRDLKEYFESHFDRLESKVDKISRGMYGDSENKVLGLIQKQEDDQLRFQLNESRLEKLEGIVKAAKWIWVAITTSVSLVWIFIGDHVKGFFK